VPGAGHLAVWSYSIYLTHKPIGNIIGKMASQWGTPPLLSVLATIVVSLLVGALLYQLVEKPFMMLRDRFFPSNFHEAGAYCPPLRSSSSSSSPGRRKPQTNLKL
jgi:peptidoglycan/LPS O-acetylase OafA/YrhL